MPRKWVISPPKTLILIAQSQIESETETKTETETETETETQTGGRALIQFDDLPNANIVYKLSDISHLWPRPGPNLNPNQRLSKWVSLLYSALVFKG